MSKKHLSITGYNKKIIKNFQTKKKLTGKAERVTIKIDTRMTQITCINCKKPYDL